MEVLTAAHTMTVSVQLFQWIMYIAVDLSPLSKIAPTPLVTAVTVMKGLVLIVIIEK